MPTVSISPFFNSHHHDNNGRPASGWLVYTYYSRTTTKKDAYKDAQGISKQENPLTLDARGEYPGGGLFLIAGESYTIVLKDPNSDTELTWHSVVAGTGGVAPVATSHTDLANLDVAGQHTIAVTTGLHEALADKVSKTTSTRQSIKSTIDFDYDESDRAFVTITTQPGDSRIDVGAEGGYVALNADNVNDPYAIVADGDGNTTATMYPYKNEYIGTDSYHKTSIGSSVKEELYKLAGAVRMYWTKAINYSNYLYESFLLQRVSDNKTLAASERNVTDSMNRNFMSLDISNTDKKAISDIILTDGQASHKLTCGLNRAQLYSSSAETMLELLHDGSYTYQQANNFGAIQKVGRDSASVETSATATRVRTEYDTATKGILIEVDESGSAKIELTANGHTAILTENNLLFDGVSIFDLFVLK